MRAGDTPDPRSEGCGSGPLQAPGRAQSQHVPGAWTQAMASLSAWLASVPTVPVLRNDN